MSSPENSTYLMILQVAYYPLDSEKSAIESAFLEHLQKLKHQLSSNYHQLVVAMPAMSEKEYLERQSSLIIFPQGEQDIYLKTLSPNFKKYSPLFILKNLIPTLKRINKLVQESNLLHTGLSSQVFFPTSFFGVLVAVIRKKPIIYVVDIDFRESALMSYKNGDFSLKSYLLCKYIYDPLRILQLKFAIRVCNLVLLKGQQMVKDFDIGKDHVKYFIDAAHSNEQIITQTQLEAKQKAIKANQPLELAYFGRLVPYKGLSYCLQALSLCDSNVKNSLRFNIIGSGSQKEELISLVTELNLSKQVIFHDFIPYGECLFEKLYSYHLLLACPLRQDTPRNAIDAMAAGMGILAFNTYYYSELTSSGAVEVVPWLSTEKLAEQIKYLTHNRNRLVEMTSAAVEFARSNTQEIWLNKRIDWTLDKIERKKNSV